MFQRQEFFHCVDSESLKTSAMSPYECVPAPFESPFAPSAVSTFPTNFVLVTVDKCYVRIAHINAQKKMQNLSIRLLLVRYMSSGEFWAVEARWRSEGKISGND